MREVDITRMGILQVGHPNFAWILFHLIMFLTHGFLYFQLKVSAEVLSLLFLPF